jgi:uncharacterized protein (DUF169 family)
MADYTSLEDILTSTLDLTRRPVAIAFRDTAPPDVRKFMGTEPSGCSFWKRAADGDTFYTVPADHHNCPIGSYTHHIPLPPGREQELTQTLSLMAEIGYVRMEEVAGIPRVPATPGVIIYAPLASTPVDPDAVILTGTPGGLMLLHEAATRGGVPMQPLFGRPTCMAIPAAMSQTVANSFGCVGNRVYTDLPGSELYSVISGKDLPEITAQLAIIASANATLREYHEERLKLRTHAAVVE